MTVVVVVVRISSVEVEKRRARTREYAQRESASENDEGREDERHSGKKERRKERENESADGRVVRTTDCIRLVFNFFPTFCFTCVLCFAQSHRVSLPLSLSLPLLFFDLPLFPFSLPQSVLDE